jgi:glyoxylate/hydroxypyruvate reductase A
VTTLLFVSRVHDPAPWVDAFRRFDLELRVRVWPDTGPAAAVDAVLAWSPPPGLLASLPNLRLISSFGAGIEHILADPSLPPRVPVTRIVEESLTRGMSEYVALHVLRHHRKLDLIQANQRAGIWKWFPPADTPRTNVGFMGLGALGAAAAQQVAQLGFPVLGWSNSEKELAGVESFVGEDQRDDFLRLCHILVCLLPLTPKTRGILNRDTMRVLPQGAYVINAGRGGHLVEADLLELLDEGHLSGATLDVFAEEPPPPEHPFWRHPKVLMTPHNAADSLPEAVAPQIIDNIRRAMSGQPLLNEVDRARGY